MKLQKNKSYLLNFARRQGKTTNLIKLVTKNAKANPSSVSLILTPYTPPGQELYIQLLSKLDNKIDYQQANTIKLKNGSKILFKGLSADINSFRGLSLSYIYVDNLLEITEDIRNLLTTLQVYSPAAKVVITTNTEVCNLSDFTSLFLAKNFELIIKPIVLKEGACKSQLEADLSPEGLRSEITLGLDYGIFK